MDNAISPAELSALQATDDVDRPLVIDVRRTAAFTEATDMMHGALRRDPEDVARWAAELPIATPAVVYCVHGHQVSQGVAQVLRASGRMAQYLDHGLEGWRTLGGAMVAKPAGTSTRWVTRARPKIDRIACPWLITRFIDPAAEFLYVPASEVRAVAVQSDALPYDIPDVAYGHHGERCSFDAFIDDYGLGSDPALERLATIVRAADTDRLDRAPQAAGLLAASLGLSHLFADDHEMLRHAMVLYDAMYRWCQNDADTSHTWRHRT